jgi:pyruvate-formate lyase-activating enzyme
VRKNLQFSVELTNYCNMKCRLCPHSRYQKDTPTGNRFDRGKGYMAGAVFDIVVENAKRYAREIVMGFFGEQTMHKSFDEYVWKLRGAFKRRMILNTNWSLVTAKMMDTIEVFDQVRISIDASNADLYEQLCPGGAFLDLDGSVAKDRYATLVRKIEHWFDRRRHPETWLIYVTSSINKHDRSEFARQWVPKTPQRDRVIMKRVVSYGGVMADSVMQKHPCHIPVQNRVAIAWSGACSPCNLDVNMALRSGHLLHQPDLGVIVNSPEWARTLSRIEARKGICANCFDSNNHTESISRAGRRK